MSTIDIIIVFLYLGVVLFIGFWVGKGNKTQEDYFVAGRSMGWIPVALSVAATTISANGFIGNPGRASVEGIQSIMQTITTPLACFIAASITVPVFYQLKISSIYEYMEMRFGKYSRNLAVLQFYINSLIQTSSMVFIPALIIQMITGWELNLIVPIIVLCTIVYTIAGGIKAVIWTDAIQMVVMWGGMIAVLIAAVSKTGLGLSGAVQLAADAGKYDAFIFTTDLTKTNGFLAAIFGVFMWTRYYCFDQVQMQRILTSKSIKGIKRSLLSSSIIINVMVMILLFVGTILFTFYNGRTFASQNEVMIDFILNNLPVGIVGLVVSATFAAAMSSVDSLLNSMTTVFTKDIYEIYIAKEKNKTLTLKQTMVISMVLGVIIILIVIFGFNGTVKSVLDVVGKYISYFSGPALGAFSLAIFTKKANDKGTALGFLVGFVSGYYIAITLKTSWLVNPAIGCFITVVFGLIFSNIFKSDKTEDEIEQYTAKGLRSKLLKENRTTEDGISLLPFSVDKYAIGMLVFFFAQYVFLAMIR